MYTNEEEIKQRLCAIVPAILERKGWSHEHFARLIDVSKQTVTNTCAGTHLPRVDRAVRIAYHLGVDLYDLLGVSVPRRRNKTPNEIVRGVRKMSHK